MTASASFAAGRAARRSVPRSSHAACALEPARNPVATIERQNRSRLQRLVPIRNERMSRSPFAFFRGGAQIMAADLAQTAVTGARVQACGDCHLGNFGLFGTPERNVIFDINDFDETLPAPWEWDVKRLAASTVLAALEAGAKDSQARRAAQRAVEAYRMKMRELGARSPLEIWFMRIDARDFLGVLDREQAARIERKQRDALVRGEHVPPRYVANRSGKLRFVEDAPLLQHLRHNDPLRRRAREALQTYTSTLRDDVRVLFSRYHLRDAAIRVVGVGSVGTHCAIALFQAGPQDVLVLQIKEESASVLEPYAGASRYSNNGQRVVAGQRLMQAASDLFLGWVELADGQQYMVRRFRDRKAAANLERLPLLQFEEYAALCGEALALAHARSGDPSFIAGYLGSSDIFDRAVAEYAVAYAVQTTRDYGSFVAALQA